MAATDATVVNVTEGQEVTVDVRYGVGPGAGDVVGPASSTDNAIARFDGTNGELLQNSGVTISDANVMAGASIDLGGNTVTGTTAQFNTALSDGNFATQAGAETLTNKTVALGSNTVSGTTAEFNTALTDGNFLTQAGTETATNKTIALGSNTVSGTKAQFDTAVTDDNFAYLATANTFTLAQTVSATTASTSSATGALIVSGGAGIYKDSYINGVMIGKGLGNGASNVALGDSSLSNSTSGTHNTALGTQSLQLDTTGSRNAAVGVSALGANTTGSYNTAVGYTAGLSIDSAHGNTCLGYEAGKFLNDEASGFENPEYGVYIGHWANGFADNESNAIVIGASANGKGSNTTVIGKETTTQAHIYGTGLNKGYIHGLTLSNDAGDLTNDIAIAAGECRDSTGVLTMISAGLTKRIDASWAVGTAAGGLDGTESVAGTPDISTWYYVWLIMRSDTGVVDALFSESSTAPTMPANYNYKRRIGAVYNDASGNILAFTQHGDEFLLSIPVNNASASNPGTSAVLRAVTAPPGMSARLVYWVNNVTTAQVFVLITSPSQADTTPTSTLFNIRLEATNRPASVELVRLTDSSSQVRIRHHASGASDAIVLTSMGWIDTRGRHA